MIKVQTLTKKHIGQWVQYDNGFDKEIGRIKSFNADTIFVVFKCNHEWHRFQDFTGEGCHPQDLIFWDKENNIPEQMP